MKKFKKAFAPLIAVMFMLVAFAGNVVNVFAADGDAAEPTNWFADNWWLIVIIVALAAFFVYSTFRRKKQVQEGQSMLDSVKPGVSIMTQGGVIGKVTEIIVMSPTDKHIVLETGGQIKSYVTYDIRAVGMILKPEQLVPQEPVEEMKMPTDEEVQASLDEAYTGKKDKEEVFPEYTGETAEDKSEKKKSEKDEYNNKSEK